MKTSNLRHMRLCVFMLEISFFLVFFERNRASQPHWFVEPVGALRQCERHRCHGRETCCRSLPRQSVSQRCTLLPSQRESHASRMHAVATATSVACQPNAHCCHRCQRRNTASQLHRRQRCDTASRLRTAAITTSTAMPPLCHHYQQRNTASRLPPLPLMQHGQPRAACCALLLHHTS